MRMHGRVDMNHAELVRALRSFGWLVQDTSSQGGGFPDLVCCIGGVVHLAEIKSKKGRLTSDQERFRESGWPFRILRTVEDVEAWTQEQV